LEIALIAANLVGKILVPFFQRSAEKVVDDLGEAVSDDAANYATGVAKTLWQRIRSRFSDDEQIILDRFEQKPEATEKLLVDDLIEKLEADPEFASELEKLLQEDRGDGNVMQIFGDGGIVDARGAQVTHGFIAGYVGSVNPAQPPPTPGPTSPPLEG
jgi:hypothetical protein